MTKQPTNNEKLFYSSPDQYESQRLRRIYSSLESFFTLFEDNYPVRQLYATKVLEEWASTTDVVDRPCEPGKISIEKQIENLKDYRKFFYMLRMDMFDIFKDYTSLDNAYVVFLMKIKKYTQEEVETITGESKKWVWEHLTDGLSDLNDQNIVDEIVDLGIKPVSESYERLLECWKDHCLGAVLEALELDPQLFIKLHNQ